MAIITGTGGDDLLQGGIESDTINGLDGRDTIDGFLGADSLNGGNGDDVFRFSTVVFSNQTSARGRIEGGEGLDTLDLVGAPGAQITPINPGAYQLQVGSQLYDVYSVERIVTGSSKDWVQLTNISYSVEVHLGAGDDFVSGGSAADILFGGPGNDQLYGEGGADWIYGGDGADTAYGQAGDHVFMEGGDDTVTVFRESGGVTPTQGELDGGAGNDFLETTLNFTTDLQTQSTFSGNTFYTLRGFENVSVWNFGGLASTVYGDAGANLLTVVARADDGGIGVLFDGRGGADTLNGSRGADTLRGGDDNDRVEGRDGADTISGDAGDDLLLGGAGDDRLDGGSGSDTVSFEDILTGSIVVNLAAGTAGGAAGADLLSGIETRAGAMAPTRSRAMTEPTASRALPAGTRSSAKGGMTSFSAGRAMTWSSAASETTGSSARAATTFWAGAPGTTSSTAERATTPSMATKGSTNSRAATAPTGSTAGPTTTNWSGERVATLSLARVETI